MKILQSLLVEHITCEAKKKKGGGGGVGWGGEGITL